jgi:hypothetical protein
MMFAVFSLSLFALLSKTSQSVQHRFHLKCDPNHYEFRTPRDSLTVTNSWFIGVITTTGVDFDGGALCTVSLSSFIVRESLFKRCQIIMSQYASQWGGACYCEGGPFSYARCCYTECRARAGQAIGSYQEDERRFGEVNESTMLRCGVAVADKISTEGTVQFQRGIMAFNTVNFTSNEVYTTGCVICVTQRNGTWTARYLNAVENVGPSIIRQETWGQSDFSYSNFVKNRIDGDSIFSPALFYVKSHGCRLVQCVFQETSQIFYAETGNWTQPFELIQCVFSTTLPVTAYVSKAGNSEGKDTSPIDLKLDDLCRYWPTACPTTSRSPVPTKTVSRAKTQSSPQSPSIPVTETPSPIASPVMTAAESQTIPQSSLPEIPEPSSSLVPQSPTRVPGGGGESGGSDNSAGKGGSSAGLGTAAFAGIAGGAVAVIAVIIAIIVMRRRRGSGGGSKDLKDDLDDGTAEKQVSYEGNEVDHDYQNPLTMAGTIAQTSQWREDE